MLRIVNHIENMRYLTTKTGLIRSLKRYYKKLQDRATELGLRRQDVLEVFDIVPTTFVVHSQFKTPDQHRFVKRFGDLEAN